MSGWFRDTEESRRLLSEERLLVAASELVSECLERRGKTRAELAEALDVKRSEITQRLSGRRNLTLRSFASMLHVLGYEVQLSRKDCADVSGTTVYHGARTTDWPEGNTRYAQRPASLRVINGVHAA